MMSRRNDLDPSDPFIFLSPRKTTRNSSKLSNDDTIASIKRRLIWLALFVYYIMRLVSQRQIPQFLRSSSGRPEGRFRETAFALGRNHIHVPSSTAFTSTFLQPCTFDSPRRIKTSSKEAFFSTYKYSFSPPKDGVRRNLDNEEQRVKPWLNIRLPVDERLESLLEAPKLHPHDFRCREMVHLIRELCKKNTLEGLEQAHQVIDRLLLEKKRYQEENIDVFIHERLWSCIIYGWGHVAKERPVAILRMKDTLKASLDQAAEDYQHDTNAPSQPTQEIFNTYLRALSFASSRKASVMVDAVETLDVMTELASRFEWHTNPNQRSFAYALDTLRYSKHPQAGKRAIQLLAKMKKTQKEAQQKYEIKFERPYDFSDHKKNSQRIPAVDSIFYNGVFKCLGYSEDGRAVNEMFGLFYGIYEEEPEFLDHILCSSVIHAIGNQLQYMKSAAEKIEALKKAQEILEIHEKLEAKNVSLSPSVPNAVMYAWASAEIEESGPGAQAIFDRMFENPKISLNFHSFQACLKAWNRTAWFNPREANEKVRSILSRQKEYGATNAEYEPNFISYLLAISAMKDDFLGKRELLDMAISEITEMPSDRRAPHSLVDAVQMFNSVIIACDTTSPNQEALEIARRTFTEVANDSYNMGIKPDHVTYASFLSCLAKNSMGTESDRYELKVIFRDICEAGQLDVVVVDILMEFDKSILPITEDGTVQIKRFWERNVPKSKWYRPTPKRGERLPRNSRDDF